MTFAIAFPAIDPVIVHLGPFAIRWYALAYIAGLVLGWRYMLHLAKTSPAQVDRVAIDDFLVWATLGVVFGGRLGYVLFYKPSFYFAHPIHILTVWQGGMSFHGGMLGVCIATILFCRQRGIALFHFADLIGCAVPIGLFFGRIANFINGELFGRPAPDVPWAMVFPMGGPIPRHPSQLYEAGMEGLILFTVLAILWRRDSLRRRPGCLAGCFFLGYATARIIGEFFRQPDPFLGYLWEGATMGQLLCIPMILFGLWLIWRSGRAGRA